MTTPLIDLSKLATYSSVFAISARACGFASHGDINRFLFQIYGKALRDIPPAGRPRGAIFFLSPPATSGALAQITALKPVLSQIRTNVARKYYIVPLDVSSVPKDAYETTSEDRKLMALGAWTSGHAQLVSNLTGKCVVWANGVSAIVYLAGDCYIETPDVVEALQTGLSGTFQSLSWDDGEIVFEFARHELNDTSQAGIWRLPGSFLLRPKPEKLMSAGLGKFLRNRMAGYRHHDEEPYVENQGRADISLIRYNGFVDIIEIKWSGRSLTAAKELRTVPAIKAALKKKDKNWVTEYGEETFASGAKQLAQYFSTGKYQRAYLTVFDCNPPASTRKNGCLPVPDAEVTPYSPSDFRILRACVDPRKASKKSKAK